MTKLPVWGLPLLVLLPTLAVAQPAPGVDASTAIRVLQDQRNSALDSAASMTVQLFQQKAENQRLTEENAKLKSDLDAAKKAAAPTTSASPSNDKDH